MRRRSACASFGFARLTCHHRPIAASGALRGARNRFPLARPLVARCAAICSSLSPALNFTRNPLDGSPNWRICADAAFGAAVAGPAAWTLNELMTTDAAASAAPMKRNRLIADLPADGGRLFLWLLPDANPRPTVRQRSLDARISRSGLARAITASINSNALDSAGAAG